MVTLEKRRWWGSLVQPLIILVLFMLTLTMLVPLLHILACSLSSPLESPGMGGLEIIPKGFTLVNYQVILQNKDILPALRNSIFITLVGTFLNILLTVLAAYALTRPNLIGKRILMVFFITMMLFDPGIVPEYIVIRKMKLMGSQWSVILSQGMNVYYLIIMMRYFEAVPPSIYEAALMDGAGHLRILFSIIMPLAKSGVATLTMFYGVLRWNEYYRSGIYISSVDKVPLQVILRRFVVDGDVTTLVGTQNLLEYNALARLDYTALQYATIVVAVIPVLLIYPLVLKFYTANILDGGTKE